MVVGRIVGSLMEGLHSSNHLADKVMALQVVGIGEQLAEFEHAVLKGHLLVPRVSGTSQSRPSCLTRRKIIVPG